MPGEIETIIRYDGPALSQHEMDVEELAPALLALASLIQSANHRFNGERSSVRVVVNADIEQQCFQIKIKLIQDLLQMARGFLDGDMATIKQICEWIGIISGASTGSVTLFKLILNLGKQQRDSTVLKAKAGDDSTVVQIQSLHLHLPDGTPPQVAELIKDPAIIAKAKEVLKPVCKPGYESVSFIEPSQPTPVFEANKDDVRAALTFEPPEQTPDTSDDEHNTIHARALVKTQRNEGRADWELKWGGRAEWASIDDQDWLDQFQSGQVPHTIPFYLDVEMDMITSKTNPDAPARYHVTKVIDVIQSNPARQQGLFNGDSSQGS